MDDQIQFPLTERSLQPSVATELFLQHFGSGSFGFNVEVNVAPASLVVDSGAEQPDMALRPEDLGDSFLDCARRGYSVRGDSGYPGRAKAPTRGRMPRVLAPACYL
jgi:hypothetical protein